MSTSEAARRRWERETTTRTTARREQVAAEAQAAAATLLESPFRFVRITGAEADVFLRDGAIIHIHVVGLDNIADIRAGDGWATAVVSPRVLNGAPGSGGTGERGDSEPFSYGHIERPWIPGSMAVAPFDGSLLCPAGLADAVRAAAKSLHPEWVPGQLNAEVQRVWDDMRGQE